MSNPEFAKTTPVTPPIVNKKINPIEKRMGAFNSTELPHKVANQLKIFIPVGIAILWIVTLFNKYLQIKFFTPTEPSKLVSQH